MDADALQQPVGVRGLSMDSATATHHDPLDELPDPTWSVIIDGFDPVREHAVESLLALANGYLGSRGSLNEGYRTSDAGTFVAGVYEHFPRPGPIPELVRAPDWSGAQIVIGGAPLSLDEGELLAQRRCLDLRRGLLLRDWRQRDRVGRITHVRFWQCVSLADRQALVQRIEFTPENYTEQVTLELLLDARPGLQAELHQDLLVATEPTPSPFWETDLIAVPAPAQSVVVRTRTSGITVAFAQSVVVDPQTPVTVDSVGHESLVATRGTWRAEMGRTYRFNRLVSVHTSREDKEPIAAAQLHAARLAARGAAAIVAEHIEAWADRWNTADIALDGDPRLQRALRFAAFHLIGAANPEDERVSIGARGLSGVAYKGHVFWDTELFMLPFFLFTDPQTARTLLMYRFHTLPAARDKARQLGYRGALYAWESADTGEEATPSEVVLPGGTVIPILSGLQEHHISADLAYAVWQYWRATRDAAFMQAAGAEILLETARFWASRAEKGPDGRFHIRQVVGPDEYHDAVDDNAFTNLLARWNLRRGLEIVKLAGECWPEAWATLKDRLDIRDAELEAWGEVQTGLVDGVDLATNIIEQFAGYGGLDELELAAHEPRLVPIDVLLGHERIVRSKVSKQADVLMALYLLWDEFLPNLRAANFRFYEPRTAHGSSLSPGIHAIYAARLGDLDRAESYLRQTIAIDLDDGMANAAEGLHMGALGSLWQAIIHGFAGVQLLDDSLVLQPQLAAEWQRLRFSLVWRGRALRIDLERESARCSLRLESGPPVRVRPAAGTERSLDKEHPLCVGRINSRWELREEIVR